MEYILAVIALGLSIYSLWYSRRCREKGIYLSEESLVPQLKEAIEQAFSQPAVDVTKWLLLELGKELCKEENRGKQFTWEDISLKLRKKEEE